MDKNNFCVVVTSDNRKELQDWWNKMRVETGNKRFSSRCWNTGSWYGRLDGEPFSDNQTTKGLTVISIEEFRSLYSESNYQIF